MKRHFVYVTVVFALMALAFGAAAGPRRQCSGR